MKKVVFVSDRCYLGWIFAVSAALIYLFIGSAEIFAQDNADKIAVIDLTRVIQSYNKSEKKYQQLKKEVEKKQKEINKSKNAVIKLQENLSRNLDSFSQKEKEKKRKNLEKRISNLQEMVKRCNQELLELDQSMKREILAEINEVVKQIARKDGYSLVIQSKGVVLYNRQKSDISNQVIKALNKKGKK